MMNENTQRRVLICGAGHVLAAIPVEHVVETMRPLPIRPFAGLAEPLAGIAVIRGQPSPVLHLHQLLGVASLRPASRFVSLRLGSRSAALAVEEVIGLCTLPAAPEAGWPSLADRLAHEKLSQIGVLDEQLVVVLRATHLLTEDVMAAAVSAGLA